MRIKLIKIGNSWGLRLPASIIKDCEIKNEIDLDVRHKHIILTPISNSRQEWGDLIEDAANKSPISTKGEWQWANALMCIGMKKTARNCPA